MSLLCLACPYFTVRAAFVSFSIRRRDMAWRNMTTSSVLSPPQVAAPQRVGAVINVWYALPCDKTDHVIMIDI